MALIKCAECGKEVSNRIKSCLYCGDDIRAQIKKAKEKPWKEMSKTEKTSTVISIGIVVALVLSIAKCALSPKTEEEIRKEEKKNAVYACRTFIEREMASPDSVEFDKIAEDVDVLERSENTYSMNLGFTAKNLFGVKLHGSYYCLVKKEGDKRRLLQLNKNP